MKVHGKEVIETFTAESSLGNVTDTIRRRLAADQWFRGEAKDYGATAVMPVLARDYADDVLTPIEPDFQHDKSQFPTRIMTTKEEEILQNFQQNHPSDPYFEKLVAGDLDSSAWLGYARHDGQPTRLLDVTSDERIGLYFACTSHPGEDGFLYSFVGCWDPENKKGQPPHYRDVFDQALGGSIPAYRDVGGLKEHAEHLYSTYNTIRKDMIYLYRCDAILNAKMNAQKGAFLWRGDPKKNLLEDTRSDNVFVFVIKAEAKQGLLVQLGNAGITKQSLLL